MSTDTTPSGPAYHAQWRYVVDAGPSDVAVARAAACATAHTWGLGALAEDIALIVAEFSANAWVHGRPPVVIMLRLEESSVLVSVSDAGPGTPVFRLIGVQGRGLPAAASIAEEIGMVADSQGTTVWARLWFQWVTPESDAGAIAA
jgi:anti-sigma regulatory factor (Ser/Thr protein kinase)